MDVKIGQDGAAAQFPDDMDEEDIKAAIENYLASPQTLQDRVSNELNRRQSFAMPYQPTLGERLSRTIGNALFDQGLISNRMAAMDIGRNFGMGAEVLPVIGDAIGGDDLGRAIKEGSAGDVALTSVAAFPVIGDVAGAVIPAIMKNRKGSNYDYEAITDAFSKDTEFDMSTIEPLPDKIDARRIVESAELEADPNAIAPSQLQVSQGYEPQETVTAYKLFRTDDDGKLYPLFVNKDKEVKVGEWEDATAGERAAPGAQRKGSKSQTASPTDKVKSSLGPLAYRPGWHAGDAAAATHIGGKATKVPLENGPKTAAGKPKAVPQYRPANQVWAKVEMPNDVDWQAEALRRADRTKAGNVNVQTAEIKDQVPYGGFYKYKTNPNMAGQWMISGNMRIADTLKPNEVRQVGEMTGVPDLPTLPEFLEQNRQVGLDDMTQSSIKELKKFYPDYYQARFVDNAPQTKVDEVLDSYGMGPASQGTRLADDVDGSIMGAVDDAIRQTGGIKEGAEEIVQDMMKVDRLLDDVPRITPQDLIGKRVAPTLADLTAGGRAYEGIDSSQVTPIELQGGPEFPMLESYFDNGIVWAVNDKGGIKKLKRGDVIAVTAMTPSSHKSNATVNQAFLNTVDAYVRDGRISGKNAKKFTKALRGNANFKDFPGLDDPEVYHDWAEGLTFDKRRMLSNVLQGKAYQNLGVPSFDKVVDATLSRNFAGYNRGDAMLFIEVTEDTDNVENLIKLGEGGTKKHRSYKYGVHGRVLGKLDNAVSYRTIFQDMMNRRRADGQPIGSDYTALMRSLPSQEITPKIADDMTKAMLPGESGIKTPRQALMVNEFLNERWITGPAVKQQAIDDGVKNPVSKELDFFNQFANELRASESSATLDQFDGTQLKAMVNNGEADVFQLGSSAGDGIISPGEGRSRIYFGIKNNADYNDMYGVNLEEAGLTPNERSIFGVVNNDPGGRGIGAAAVMLKAIKEGATVLDAYSVKSDKYPDGFLPSLYGEFGFKTRATIPFDESFHTEPGKMDDLKAIWSKYGWKEGDGYPDIVVMKYEGSDNARATIQQDWLDAIRRGDETSFIGKATPESLRESDEAIFQSRGAGSGQTRQGQRDTSGNTGDIRDSNSVSFSERAGSVVRSLDNLTDEQKLNLGIQPKPTTGGNDG